MSHGDESPEELGFEDQQTTEVEAVAFMIKLVGLTGAYTDRVYPIDKAEFVIGRSHACDLVLEEQTISGRHARISKVGDHCEVEDLGSTNGVFVNDRPVDRQTLRTQDVVTFDEVQFRYINPREVSRTIVSPRKDLLDFGTQERKSPTPQPHSTAPKGDEAPLAKTTPAPDPASKPASQDASLTSAPTAPLPVVVPDREDSGPHSAGSLEPTPRPPKPDYGLPPSPSVHPSPSSPPSSPPRPPKPDRNPPPTPSMRPAPPPPPARTSPDLIINTYQPGARHVRSTEPEEPASGPISSLFTGLTFAVLFSFFGTFLSLWGQLKFAGDPMAILKSMIVLFPFWHTHAAWLHATWNPSAIITIICLPLGPFLGGLLTQSMWRERPAATAAIFSVIYALGFISLHIVALDFQLDNVTNLHQIGAIGVADPALAMLTVYGMFLVVVFVLSLLGTLLGKR